MAATEDIVFNGITFRRYPEARCRTDRLYYTPIGGARQRGVLRLHQEVWKAAYGVIPEGFHVHHKDGNPLNNTIENLQCLDARAHHHEDALRGAYKTGPRKAHLDRIRPRAADWHRSPEGQEYHRNLGRLRARSKQPQQFTCEYCGKLFETVRTGNNRFCSNACRAYARKASGVDDEERVCAECGAPFVVNRYARNRYCSRACSCRVARAARKSGLQPPGS
jgi:hypothetical protein